MDIASIDSDSVRDAAREWFPPAWALAPGPAGPLRVLVCEPRAALRRQAGAAFRDAALETTFAATVADALHLARTGSFNAIVVDPEMDGGNGMRLCAAVARGHGGADVPVVTWCESRSLILAVRARIAGAQVHLMRPVALDRFVSTVWDVAARHARLDHCVPATP